MTATDIYYDPYDYAIDEDPYPVWKRMRDEAPVYYNEQHDFYALTRYDDVRAASIDWQHYQSGRGSVLELIRNPEHLALVQSILFMDPPEHDRYRALAARVFSPRRVAQMEARTREICVDYLDRYVGSGGFDFVSDFGALLPMMVICSFLGIPKEDQDTIRVLADLQLHRDEGQTTQSEVNIGVTIATMKYFDAALAIRRFVPRDDFITELSQAELTLDDGTTRKLDEGELLRFLGLLAAAGNETVARLMSWSGALLAQHPDQRRELAENPSLIPAAIEEILRFEAPSPVQARFVPEGVEVHGTKIPQDSVALLLTAAANRDERKFTDPDVFDIHRKPEQHMSFGVGVHFCLGASLARLEARVALEEVLKRFPEWDVDWPGATRVRTSTVRGYEHLPITF